jgi:allantoicase
MNEQKLKRLVNLADARLGAKATFVTDDWFAEVNRMLNPEPPVWKEGVYDDAGKWMDGWESRRKRFEGYDYAIIRLGAPGMIQALEINTNFFTGNFPPSASVDVCYSPDQDPDEQTKWYTLLPSVDLKGDSEHLFEVNNDQPWSHVRLNIYPDGGIARFRVYGRPYIDWNNIDGSQKIDLVSALNGGCALSCSDEHFGKMGNLTNPGRGVNMGDGWETARRRSPGYDWVILALGSPGIAEEIEIDTAHFKGNFPDSCDIQAAYVRGGSPEQIATQSLFWKTLLPNQKLSADSIQTFSVDPEFGPITHVKLNIHPDGGVSRLRVFGKPTI